MAGSVYTPPGDGSLQRSQARAGTGDGLVTRGPVPSLEGRCFIRPLEGRLPRAAAAPLEPPRPPHQVLGRRYQAHCPVGHAQMESHGVFGSGAAHKVCCWHLPSRRGGGEEPGPTCRNADSPSGQARITSCPTPAWLPLAAC